jgi:hypothetical protein
MKYRLLLLTIGIAVLTNGCSTAISDFTSTERDQQIYKLPSGCKNIQSTNSYVIKTKGSGEVACINLGEKDGLATGDKIDFYKIKSKNGKNFNISFASGRIMKLSETTSWVQVSNYETANVKENHFARLADDQSYSLGEKMLYPPRFFKKKK